MAFRNKAEKKTEYDTDKVRVRNSYYTFSREYPSKNILHRRKSVRKRIMHGRIIKGFVSAVCFLLIALCAFFVTDLSVKISYKPYEKNHDLSQLQKTEVSLSENGVRAWYLPVSELSDKDYLKSFVSSVKRKDGTAVVIDFKDENGRICYSSDNENAILSKAAVYDNETVRNAISFIKSKNLSVIGRIYCFQDNTVAAGNTEFAVTYLDSDVNWLDENGKAWLNPFSSEARKYINYIIKETLEFSVDGILLEAVSFPYDGATETSTYRGRKGNDSCNELLKKFISDVKKSLPEDKLLYVSLTATDTIKGNKEKYEGSIAKNKADAVAVYVSDSPDGYVIDKKSKYQSLLSLLSKASSSVAENKAVLPIVDQDVYTSSLKRVLMKNGYRSYFVF